MNPQFLSLLRCPRTAQALHFEHPTNGDGTDGYLVSSDGVCRYPIINCVPRFVPSSNYADSFGMQWNHFRRTQLDSYSGVSISADRFWAATGWNSNEMKGKWVLDAGCGAGRFAEIAIKAGANVVALDYSSAVDACAANLGNHSNLHVIQADIYALPFEPEAFDYVYSLGVLQHTPNVAHAFFAVAHMVSAGGWLCTDYYWKRFRTLMHSKYLVRPLVRNIPKDKLFGYVRSSLPAMLGVSRLLGRIPLIGRGLRRLIPVADYTGIFPLSEEQLSEWALLDTFDMLSPTFDKPQTAMTVRRWMEAAGMVDVEVLHAAHLVCRGRKPKVHQIDRENGRAA